MPVSQKIRLQGFAYYGACLFEILRWSRLQKDFAFAPYHNVVNVQIHLGAFHLYAFHTVNAQTNLVGMFAASAVLGLARDFRPNQVAHCRTFGC